jgi:hypothetical protein
MGWTRDAFVDLAWQVATADPRDVFQEHYRGHRLSRTGGIDRSQPGYLGRDYQPGNWVFIAKNPAAGGDGYSSGDQELKAALDAFASSTPEERGPAFDEVMECLRTFLPTWKTWIYASALGARVEEIAWLNVLPWRTKSESYPKRLGLRSWNALTGPMVEALEPDHSRIVVLGLTNEAPVARLGLPESQVVKRSRGDTHIPEVGRQTLAALRA